MQPNTGSGLQSPGAPPQQQLVQPQQQQQQQQPPAQVKLIDLRPSANSNVNTTVILLEKGQVSRTTEGGPPVCVALVADSTAAVHLQLWGPECDAFQPSDIIRLTNGLFSSQKNNMVLRAGKKGSLEKIGQFTMVFVETPNMSRLQWVPDPGNPKLLMPVGVGVGVGAGTASSPPQAHGMPGGNNFRGYH